MAQRLFKPNFAILLLLTKCQFYQFYSGTGTKNINYYKFYFFTKSSKKQDRHYHGLFEEFIDKFILKLQLNLASAFVIDSQDFCLSQIFAKTHLNGASRHCT